MNGVPRILLVDFDNTLFHQLKYPYGAKSRIGNRLVQAYVRYKKRKGWFVIVNTARHDQALDFASLMLDLHQIPYDLINENHPALVAKYGDTRKICGTRMLDDMQLGLIGWLLRHFC